MKYLRVLIQATICLFLTNALGAEEPAWSSWVALKDTGKNSFTATPGEPADRVVDLIPKEKFTREKPRKILILFPKKSSAYNTALEQILLLFQGKRLDAAFTLYFFDKDAAFGKEALAKAEAEGYDLVFSMGSDSTDFVHAHYNGGKLPVVTICSKDPVLRGQLKDYESGSGTNIAYTSLDMPVKIQLDYLRILMPDLRQVVALYARQNKSAYETQVLPLVKSCRGTDVNVRELVVENAVDARKELAAKVAAARAVLEGADPGLKRSIFWITGSTEVFAEMATIVAQAAGVPVLSVVPDVVVAGGDSAVLSIGVGFESNAQLAAFYAVRILKGEEQPGKLPVGIVSPPDIAINFQKVRETGLKIPFRFFERASIIFDYTGNKKRGK